MHQDLPKNKGLYCPMALWAEGIFLKKARPYPPSFGPRNPLRKTYVTGWNKHTARVVVRASDHTGWISRLRELLGLGTDAVELPEWDEEPSGLLLLSWHVPLVVGLATLCLHAELCRTSAQRTALLSLRTEKWLCWAYQEAWYISLNVHGIFFWMYLITCISRV